MFRRVLLEILKRTPGFECIRDIHAIALFESLETIRAGPDASSVVDSPLQDNLDGVGQLELCLRRS
jgi:hypothetical protein